MTQQQSCDLLRSITGPALGAVLLSHGITDVEPSNPEACAKAAAWLRGLADGIDGGGVGMHLEREVKEEP